MFESGKTQIQKTRGKTEILSFSSVKMSAFFAEMDSYHLQCSVQNSTSFAHSHFSIMV